MALSRKYATKLALSLKPDKCKDQNTKLMEKILESKLLNQIVLFKLFKIMDNLKNVSICLILRNKITSNQIHFINKSNNLLVYKNLFVMASQTVPTGKKTDHFILFSLFTLLGLSTVYRQFLLILLFNGDGWEQKLNFNDIKN